MSNPEIENYVADPEKELLKESIQKMKTSLKSYLPLCGLDIPEDKADDFFYHVGILTGYIARIKAEKSSLMQRHLSNLKDFGVEAHRLEIKVDELTKVGDELADRLIHKDTYPTWPIPKVLKKWEEVKNL